jgi:hypothetical protein
LEIDALVALSLGISIDELCSIYRTQFPVLHGYDTRSKFFDACGREVPTSILSNWRKNGGNSGAFREGDLVQIHPGSGTAYEYVLPFETLDREADMRSAYAEFELRLAASRSPDLVSREADEPSR